MTPNIARLNNHTYSVTIFIDIKITIEIIEKDIICKECKIINDIHRKFYEK